ncbi:MAG: hypothetical protein CMG49_05410 [Candidatus Marinimicrobia bacterium]|nr:hypothetical protein [Candidatus Neomarinimicrobiota bacterium]|tara:strand:- start:4457 stop:4906 length:450 start_codon:yes stop_codon:yes gene_type:complete
MKINAEGLNIIKHFEGFSPTVYLCPANRWTIGYGSTWDKQRKPVTKSHPPITEEDGEYLLRQELDHCYYAIDKLVTAEITENMHSALCSFIFNVGSGNFQSSTMRMKLNRGNYEGASAEFPKWRRAGGKILQGLVRRRTMERELFDIDI